MKLILILMLMTLGTALAPALADATTQPSAQTVSPLDFAMKDIDGHNVDLSQYRGKVVMLVNVASKCGYTKQYDALEKLYEADKDRGLVIIGFPANNFKQQEPGTDQEIKAFCTAKYNVTFPMMSKISVKGDDMAPLYQFLTSAQTDPKFAGDIGWNFTKFIVDRNGQVVARFESKVKPTDPELVGAVEQALGK